MIEFIVLPLAFIVGVELAEFSLYGFFVRNHRDVATLIKFINKASEVEVVSDNEIVFYTGIMKRNYTMVTIRKKQLLLSKYSIRIRNSVDKKIESSRVLRRSEAEIFIEYHFNKWQRRDKEMPDGKQVRIIG